MATYGIVYRDKNGVLRTKECSTPRQSLVAERKLKASGLEITKVYTR